MNKNSSPSLSYPYVSIVILNYNGKAFIKRCLETVLADPYEPKEILLVDNASQDLSLEIARPWQDRITIVENPKNYGFPKGCNKGIQLARGDIIVLLNIDTSVRENWLTELIQPFMEDASVGITGSKLLFLDGKTIQFAGGSMRPNGLTSHEGYGMRDSNKYDIPKDVEYITGASMAIRRDLLEKAGGLDEGFPLYYEDIDLCFRVRRLGYRIRYQPGSVVFHYETFGTKKQSHKYFFKYHRGRIRFILKHFGLRYFLFSFIPDELSWYGECKLTQQILPLFRAYLAQFFKAPYFWCRGFVIRRRIKKQNISV